jgi:hypothetical protein
LVEVAVVVDGVNYLRLPVCASQQHNAQGGRRSRRRRDKENTQLDKGHAFWCALFCISASVNVSKIEFALSISHQPDSLGQFELFPLHLFLGLPGSEVLGMHRTVHFDVRIVLTNETNPTGQDGAFEASKL